MSKNHSQRRQPSPRHTLSLRSSLPLASPLLPSSHYRCYSHYRCCLESSLPHTSTAPSPLPPSLRRCCLAHVYPSLSSSSLFSFLLPLSIPHLSHSFSLSLTSASRPHPDSVCLSICSVSQFPFLSPPLIPSSDFLAFPLHARPNVQTLRFPSFFSFFSLPLHTPALRLIPLPRCSLDRDDLSRSENETEKRPAATEELVVLGWGGVVSQSYARSLDKESNTYRHASCLSACLCNTGSGRVGKRACKCVGIYVYMS